MRTASNAPTWAFAIECPVFVDAAPGSSGRPVTDVRTENNASYACAMLTRSQSSIGMPMIAACALRTIDGALAAHPHLVYIMCHTQSTFVLNTSMLYMFGSMLVNTISSTVGGEVVSSENVRVSSQDETDEADISPTKSHV